MDETLTEHREDICRMVCEEFGDRVTRHSVANQIRVAMGLSPHELFTVEGENDIAGRRPSRTDFIQMYTKTSRMM